MGKTVNQISSSKERFAMRKAAKTASLRAGRISKALDLPIQVIIKGNLVEKTPDGSIKTIKKIERLPSDIELKKGSKLWLKPKG